MSDAISNAQAWMETIDAAMTALDSLDAGAAPQAFDGDTFDNADELRERLEEMPLSVQVRDGWRSPGQQHEAEAEEYSILLSTGGPALRIYGMVNGCEEAETARLQYQDWGTPWTDLDCETNDLSDPVLAFARLFYLAEG